MFRVYADPLRGLFGIGGGPGRGVQGRHGYNMGRRPASSRVVLVGLVVVVVPVVVRVVVVVAMVGTAGRVGAFIANT